MSEVPTPSEGSTHLDEFLGLRESLCTARSGHGGREVCEALTASLDSAVEQLLSPLPEGVAVVAVGGYGRRELSLFSDVDLMLLHGVDDPTEIASALFRPLWDAKLRVGHSARTVKEAVGAAKERFDTHTTLLTSRLIAGDPGLFARYTSGITSVTRARPLRRHLVARERARREEVPFLLMAADIKSGRGGLRTLHGFEWERRREDLIGRFTSDSRPEEDRASESLLRVRNALHASAGRAHDVFSVDLRQPVALWLGVEVDEAAEMLVDAMQTVDRLATRRWPEVVEDKGLLARLRGKPPPLRADRRPNLSEFVWLLESGEQGRLDFERLWEDGFLDEVLPEWSVVRSLPQLAPFHEHPVAAHLWRTVDEMSRLLGEDGRYGRIGSELANPAVLLLAAFLHDIGKGHGGDHATVGAEIAEAFCERMDVPARSTKLIVGSVRHHLLLARTATRRDLDDPGVIEEVAEAAGSLEMLQVLYLLTVADSRATGPTMWNAWKATLLQTLFLRAAAVHGADHPDIGTTPDVVISATDPERQEAVVAHLDAMPDEYIRSVSASEVLRHLDLIDALEGRSKMSVTSDGAVDTAVVVGRRAPAFRRWVAEALAANGVDVLEARLFGRSDGILVDTYRVRADRAGGRVESEKWESVRADIEAALCGELDTGSKVAARAAAYDEPPGDRPEVRGQIDAASGELVVVVKCSDRIGRLAEIVSVLDGCGLNIRLAKLDSREGEVVDTFHVEDQGRPLVGVEIASLEQRISGALTP